MGRPSCSSCCKVSVAIPQKKGCIDNNYKIYYKYGAGGWKTSDEYEEYLKKIPITIEVGIKVYYPIGSEDIYIVDEIIEGVAPDPDKVKLRDEDVPVDISEVEPVRNGFNDLEEIKYVSSKSDYGEYASELNCWNFPKAFFDVNKTAVEINEEFQAGNPDYGVHIPKFWTITLGDNDEMVIVRKLEGLGSFTNHLDGIGGSYDFQREEKTYTVIWTTEILYKGQTIFSGSKCIPYKQEIWTHNLENGTRSQAPTENLMWFDGKPSLGQIGGSWVGGEIWGDLVPYSNFDYCLTFPFFSFDQNTHYFHEGPDSNFIPAPQGTIDEDLDGKLEFYHADKGLFTKISVESKDFIVFNPYTGGLGRDVTPNELAQEYQGDTLKEQEKLVNKPFFQYTDNKLNLEGDIPQDLTIEESPRGNLIGFPAGWPGNYDQPNGVRETFRKYTGTNTGYMEDPNNPDVFVPSRWGTESHNNQTGYWQRNGSDGYDINDVIFVHFRTNRGADESGIDIEEDMEVYHPVGSGNKYTIDEIVATGPDLKPTKVKLSNGAVVDVSDIELVDDALYYAMNKRTYYLQTIYLKALSTKEGKDFFDPFKYRVTRIDFTNPDIDIDSVGDEIAGPPKMGVDENPTYITMTTEYSYGNVPELRKKHNFATFMKLTEDSPVTLESTKKPPMSLKDDIVITAPTMFSGPSKYDPNTGEFVANPNVLKFPRSPYMNVKVLNNWVLPDPIGDGSHALTFSHRQLPKSGYFFGNFVNLKFYLQEIDEWKKA